MQYRNIANTDIKVGRLAFGGNVFGWTADEAQSFKLLDAFVDSGLNLIDTADIYSTWTGQPGISETIIGKWLKKSGKRNKVVIATKVGMEMAPGKVGLSRSHIISSIEGSLKRLQTEYVDLYQSHRDDSKTPIEESMQAYAELVKQGKVKAIGASNFSAERLAQSLSVSKKLNIPHYVTLQPQYNLYDRAGFEKDLQAVCLKNNIGVISYYSLASGFLTGKYRSEKDANKSARGQGVIRKYMNDRGLHILKALDQVAEAKKATPAQVALAWLMAQPTVLAPIASATNVEQLHDLIRSTQLELDPKSLDLLNI